MFLVERCTFRDNLELATWFLVSVCMGDWLEAVAETCLGEATGGCEDSQHSLKVNKTLTATS